MGHRTTIRARPRKVLVCGSRRYRIDEGDGMGILFRRLDALSPKPLEIITGGANGPDDWARRWAVSREVDHHVFYARWRFDGKRAGLSRNLRMLDEDPELVLAFWDGESRGTKHTIEEARTRGIAVEVIAGG